MEHLSWLERMQGSIFWGWRWHLRFPLSTSFSSQTPGKGGEVPAVFSSCWSPATEEERLSGNRRMLYLERGYLNSKIEKAITFQGSAFSSPFSLIVHIPLMFTFSISASDQLMSHIFYCPCLWFTVKVLLIFHLYFLAIFFYHFLMTLSLFLPWKTLVYIDTHTHTYFYLLQSTSYRHEFALFK